MKEKKMYLLVRMSDDQEVKIYEDSMTDLFVHFTMCLCAAERAGLSIYPEMFDRILVGYKDETDI